MFGMNLCYLIGIDFRNTWLILKEIELLKHNIVGSWLSLTWVKKIIETSLI